jgi:hypothetical protein
MVGSIGNLITSEKGMKLKRVADHKLKCLCGKCNACKMREYKRRVGSRKITCKVSNDELSMRMNEYWDRVKTDEYQGRQRKSSMVRVQETMENLYGSN